MNASENFKLTMEYKDRADAFYYLYRKTGENGRKEELFGELNEDTFAEALYISMLASERPTCYWEFPLAGEPWLDLIMLNGTDAAPMLTDNTAYPYMAAFKKADEVATNRFCYGLEWDISKTEKNDRPEPGFYIDNASDDTMLEAVLKELGEEKRWSAVQDFFDRLPASWKRYYLGLFPDREGSPVRFGIIIDRNVVGGYREKPEILKKILLDLGFTAFDDDMVDELMDPVYEPFGWEIQFDLFTDGSLGPDLGLLYNCRKNKPDEAVEYLKSEKMQKVFAHLEEINIADKRWQRLTECVFTRISYNFIDGRSAKFYIGNRTALLKLKWHGGRLMPAKFYLEGFVREI